MSDFGTASVDFSTEKFMNTKRVNITPALVLAAALALSLGACGRTPGSGTGASEVPYKIVMPLLTRGSLPDLPKVQAELNRYLKDRNLEVEFLPLSYAAMQNQLNLMITGGEKLDVMPVLSATFSNDVAQGKLIDLNDLLKTRGAATAAAVGNEYLKAGTVDGKIYGIPSLRDMAAGYGICMRKDILDKYGFRTEDIKTIEDISRLFTAVSAGEKDMYMTFGQGNTISIVNQLMVDWDGLGDNFGVLMNHGQDAELKVVNLFATKEYENKLRIIRDWYRKGWIIPDAATNTEPATRLVGAGQLFSFCANLKPGFDKQSTLGAGGVEMVTADIMPAFSTTTQVGIMCWTIPITCKNPERTMDFLNLLFTDPAVVNFIDWGIEGTHYVKLNDYVIGYPPGINASGTGYNMNLSWFYGNSLIGYVWEGNPPDTNRQMIAFNKNAIVSKALGFQFDAIPVRTAIAAVQNAAGQYRLSLEYGMVDVDSALPRFIKALEDAGIGQIIAEKQRQLDRWLDRN
ncbi:MAG: ABC transporter substrate-binding protein [Treponema sp.]|jgi:putative aldouronate transport system substrate-binding protein|nr:ABC transporter substrate-binding protein [Treponema sp.]